MSAATDSTTNTTTTSAKNKLVIKVGGALLHDMSALQSLLQTLAQLQQCYQLVLVHGGGDTVQALLEKLDFESHKIDGVRVTPEEQIPYVVGALAGTVNTQLCAAALSQSLKPVGLTLLDGGITSATPLAPKFGAVGSAVPGDAVLLEGLCGKGFLPIISSIASTSDGQLLNVNADDAAAAIAQLLQADLLLLSDVPGVLDGSKQLLPELNEQQIEHYCQQGVIQGGMVIKVNSALITAKATQKSVFIASWKQPQGLLALSQGSHSGTRIFSEIQSSSQIKASQGKSL